MSSTDTRDSLAVTTPETPVAYAVSPETRVVVLALHAGHHAMWASEHFQADICNMADDWVVLDLQTGILYRFPIVDSLMLWSRNLISAMNAADLAANNPWSVHNQGSRTRMLDAAINNRGDRRVLSVFDPGFVSPAVATLGFTPVDQLLSDMIAAHPDAVVGE